MAERSLKDSFEASETHVGGTYTDVQYVRDIYPCHLSVSSISIFMLSITKTIKKYYLGKNFQEEIEKLCTPEPMSRRDDEKSPLLVVSTNHEQQLVLAEDQEMENLDKAQLLLYISHFIATFAELGWQFCLTLFLAALTNFQSFTLVATYGLFTGVIVFFTSSSTGAMIDNNSRNRLETAQLFIWVQNLSVVIGSTCCFFLLRCVNDSDDNNDDTSHIKSTWIPNLAPPGTMTTWLLLASVHIFGAVGKLTDQSMTVALERDWIVVMAKVAGGQGGDSNERQSKEKSWLTQANTTMKQIDLTCKVVAPAAAGIFFGYFDNNPEGSGEDLPTQWNNLSSAAMIVGIANLISLLVENFMIIYIYQLVPQLAVKRNKRNDRVEAFNYQNHQKYPFLPRGLDLYIQQPISFGGFAAALLYLNILSFGAMMTAYLVFRGMSYKSIGILRGFSSTIGILGTFAYRISMHRYNLIFTGSWSIIFQFLCLSLSFASLYISDDNLSLSLLIIGVIASRVGLYSFKLTITQMMQHMIAEDIRGTIGGVQKSLNGLFDLATYGLGLIFSKPEQFHILIATGFTSVGIACYLYIWGTHKHRNIILMDNE